MTPEADPLDLPPGSSFYFETECLDIINALPGLIKATA